MDERITYCLGFFLLPGSRFRAPRPYSTSCPKLLPISYPRTIPLPSADPGCETVMRVYVKYSYGIHRPIKVHSRPARQNVKDSHQGKKDLCYTPLSHTFLSLELPLSRGVHDRTLVRRLEHESDGADEQGGEGSGNEDGKVEAGSGRSGGPFREAVEVSFPCCLSGCLKGSNNVSVSIQ